MNGLNLYINVSAVVIAVGSALLNFTGRQKYKDQSTFFESSNHELREQNASLREEKSSLTNELTQAKTESTQKDEIIKQLKPFSEIAKIMSNNHKEVMQTMSDNFSKVAAMIQEGKNGKS